MKEAVVIWAKRTPFGKYGGALRHLEPEARCYHFSKLETNIS